MQFKLGEYPKNYHANHFVYEIARSKMMIEILQSLNKTAIGMSNKGLLYKALMPTADDENSDTEERQLIYSKKSLMKNT